MRLAGDTIAGIRDDDLHENLELWTKPQPSIRVNADRDAGAPPTALEPRSSALGPDATAFEPLAA